MPRFEDTNAGRVRQRQLQWRERLPELRRIVEDVSPRIWEMTQTERLQDIPEAWRELVTAMQQEVHAKSEAVDYLVDESASQRRGYFWSWKIDRVAAMLKYLTGVIREDIGFEDGATLGSIALLDAAILQLELELQDGGTKEGRDDSLENQYRVQQALRPLNARFDDVQMKRLRALQVAGASAKISHIPDEKDIEERLEKSARGESMDADAIKRRREWMSLDQPAMSGVMARTWLAEVDERFASLDPLIVLEEFADATAETEGGRTESGDGRTGAVRALARLAVMCGALEFEQNSDETFDAAVERARAISSSRGRAFGRQFAVSRGEPRTIRSE